MMMMIGAAAVVGGVLLPMEAMADNPSILLNGSFESYVAGTNDAFTNTQLHAGMSATRHPNNWSYTSGAGLCASGDDPFLGKGNVPDGSIAVYLQNSGAISQSVTVTDAGTYEISFRYASRPNYLNGTLYVKIISAGNSETEIGSVTCPVTAFRTAYMKVYLAAGNYTLKIEHAKASGNSGDSIVDMVAMRRMDNLVSNASFEDYRNENNNWTGTYKGFVAETFMPEAWGYSGSLVMQKLGTPFMSAIPDGAIAVAMRNKAVLTQQIVAPTTGVYEVSFKYGKRSNSGSVKLFACLDDEALGSVTLTTNAVRTAYFKANLEAGTSYTLSITNNATSDATNTDSGIDLVSVVASTNLILNGGFDYGTVDPYQHDGQYLQSNQTGYINPCWKEFYSTGRVGLAVSGSTWINAALDVGTYALWMQTLPNYNEGVSVWQDFKVNAPGVYRLSFVHAKRSNTVNPVTKARIRKGKGLDGEIVYEKEATSSHYDAFEQFAANVKLEEAGVYTLEFRRDVTTADITAVIDDVSLTYFGKIAKGLTIIVR